LNFEFERVASDSETRANIPLVAASEEGKSPNSPCASHKVGGWKMMTSGAFHL